jgi:hypothetical protein
MKKVRLKALLSIGRKVDTFEETILDLNYKAKKSLGDFSHIFVPL